MAAEAATDTRPNKVTITEAGPATKKIAIEIPAATVKEQLGSSLETLMLEAELPGFRKGRAPQRLVEKRFGAAVRREAKNQLVASAYSQAIEEHKLRVLGDPVSPELEKLEIIDGKPLAFEVEVEVLPEFDLPSLDGIAVKKPTLSVTDEMVNEEINKICVNEGELESRETPEAGDYLTGRGVMTEGDQTLVDIQDAVIQVPPADKKGKGMILGIMVDDLAKQLGLPKAGDTATIKVTGPENHENENIRGKKLTISFTPARVDRIIPAKLAGLVERFGFENEQALKDNLRARLEQRVAIDQQTAMRNQVARHLLKTVKLDPPKRMTSQQAERNLLRRRYELMHRGVEAQKIEEHTAELRAASGEAAAQEIKLFFIMDKAAESLDVKVSEAEINGRIAQIAMSRNERPEKLRQDLINNNQVGMIFQQIREHKAMDAILAKAKITDVPAEEFAALMKE